MQSAMKMALMRTIPDPVSPRAKPFPKPGQGFEKLPHPRPELRFALRQYQCPQAPRRRKSARFTPSPVVAGEKDQATASITRPTFSKISAICASLTIKGGAIASVSPVMRMTRSSSWNARSMAS